MPPLINTIMVGRAGIEPATAATSRRCHTTRPPAPPTTQIPTHHTNKHVPPNKAAKIFKNTPPSPYIACRRSSAWESARLKTGVPSVQITPAAPIPPENPDPLIPHQQLTRREKIPSLTEIPESNLAPPSQPITPGSTLIPPPHTGHIDLIHEPLREKMPQNTLQRLPRQISPRHDTGRLLYPALNRPQHIEIDLQLNPATHRFPMYPDPI